MTADDDSWKAAWQPVIDAIGRDLDEGEPIVWGADLVEAGAIRRYLEPLEFDCPLHYDRDVARAHGHDDIIAPYTSLGSFVLAPMWSPGQTTFTSADRNAQPAFSAVRTRYPDYFPPYTAGFATGLDLEFIRPAKVGDRLARRARKLTGCEPKATKVGRGAFLKVQSEIVDTQGDILMRAVNGSYLYTPYDKAAR